ncbi:response regulator transcription factor [Roseivivax isoporae]|uniref:Transcriptional regulator n=1 Tax=Roseivivax isoporae LMG 25204 TaxID=1449351 RepID=X7F9X3_9RHOB|nr:response regulator transcription factor [Roseivivax isoporae]ETX28894.1 transcriptional regulator [Roseivivax isoporae LMG 25204]
MNIYLYEPRDARHRGLADELARADIVAVPADARFLDRPPETLRVACPEGAAFLLADTPETLDYIRNLRRAELHGPILVMRDLRNARATADSLDAGADDDVVLPIKAVEMRSRINSILRRAGGHAAESTTVGEVTVYFDGRNPDVCGVAVHLSRREHAILRHLALNATRVVSKQVLYDAVYGLSEDQPFDKVIDVYICKIRKKLSAAAASGHVYIETVHRRGYKLTAPQPVQATAAE